MSMFLELTQKVGSSVGQNPCALLVVVRDGLCRELGTCGELAMSENIDCIHRAKQNMILEGTVSDGCSVKVCQGGVRMIEGERR